MMANEEHVQILKQGVDKWNQWRKGNRDIRPNLRRANLKGAKLQNADLRSADLMGARLSRAQLSNANMRGATLIQADLSRSVLITTDLLGANLSRANLTRANLRKSNLLNTNLSGADLRLLNLAEAFFGATILADVDLSIVTGLDDVFHTRPSHLDFHTIYRSKGNIPEKFLRGVGLSDASIANLASFVTEPVGFYSCFISHSGGDSAIAKQIYSDLQDTGVRCWFAPEDMKIGDHIRVRIEESILLHDKVLLVLSEHSLSSVWVADEVEAALEKERLHHKTVLFPIALDDAIWASNAAWAAKVRRERHIGDFRRWKDDDAYRVAFERLLRDLQAEEG